MKNLEQAIDQLEEYVLKSNSAELEAIYLNIKSQFNIAATDHEDLIAENSNLERDIEERKEEVWSNPALRRKIIATAAEVVL